MYDILFLNDVFSAKNIDKTHKSERRHNPEKLNKWSFWSRYMGPYAAKQAVINSDPTLKVKIIDYFTKIPDFFSYIKDFVNEDTRYIGISTTFLNNTSNKRVNDFNLWFNNHKDLVDWFRQLKEVAPNAKIIIGGHLCDVWFQYYVKTRPDVQLPEAMEKYVDCVIHGYAESSLPKYLKKQLDSSHMYYRGNTLFVSDNSSAGSNSTTCLKVNWTAEEAVQYGEWLPLEISKGCRFGCKFCMYDRFGTTIKNKEILKAELISNYKNFGITGYQITDDTVNDSLAKVKMIHEVIMSLPFKIEWIAYARPDMFYKYPEMLDLMVESGCRGMFLGIETFNPIAAKTAGKGLDPEKIKNIIKWIKQKTGDDLFILASFIIGLVGETEESLESTLQYLLNQQNIDKILFEVLYVRPPDFRTGAKKDFNNNSSLYGFKKVVYNPYYWEHDTLNFTQCMKIAQHWKTELEKTKYSGFDQALEGLTNFWSYPRMRSLGYSHKESFYMLKDASMTEELYIKNDNWIKNYHQNLRKKK
jgi:radical SAM superfamily enzyme YgiQ (UPF0313 family)